MKLKMTLFLLTSAFTLFPTLGEARSYDFEGGYADTVAFSRVCRHCKNKIRHSAYASRLPTRTSGRIHLAIDRATKSMLVFQGTQLIRRYPIGIGGKFHHGRYHFTPQHLNVAKVGPTEWVHYSRKYNNAPLRYAIHLWGDYFIHVGSTSKPGNGCIHLGENHARELFNLIRSASGRNATFRVT